MTRYILIFFLALTSLTGISQIDLDYALDDGNLSARKNVLSLSVDNAFRGEVGVFYTREFKTMDLSMGVSRQFFDALEPDLRVLDMYEDLEQMSISESYRVSFNYDQILQSVENYGFSFRIHYQDFLYEQTGQEYRSIGFNSGLIFKPVFNNSLYLNFFTGLGGFLYEAAEETGISVYLALECRVGYKFKL